MEVIRVSKESEKAGVYYVRVKTMCLGFNCSLEGEFTGDNPDSLYVLAMEGNEPVATCRLDILNDEEGQIERVSTLPEYQGKHYGEACIYEAEKWLLDKGIKRVKVNSRVAALGFYAKLGYRPLTTEITGGGDFLCIMVGKNL